MDVLSGCGARALQAAEDGEVLDGAEGGFRGTSWGSFRPDQRPEAVQQAVGSPTGVPGRVHLESTARGSPPIHHTASAPSLSRPDWDEELLSAERLQAELLVATKSLSALKVQQATDVLWAWKRQVITAAVRACNQWAAGAQVKLNEGKDPAPGRDLFRTYSWLPSRAPRRQTTKVKAPTAEEVSEALDTSMMPHEATRKLFDTFKEWKVLGTGTYGSAYKVKLADGTTAAYKTVLLSTGRMMTGGWEGCSLGEGLAVVMRNLGHTMPGVAAPDQWGVRLYEDLSKAPGHKHTPVPGIVLIFKLPLFEGNGWDLVSLLHELPAAYKDKKSKSSADDECEELGSPGPGETDVRINLKQVLETWEDVAMGLQNLHECGIVHGDLKANNTLWRWDRELKRFKGVLSDLGTVQPVPPGLDGAIAEVTTVHPGRIPDTPAPAPVLLTKASDIWAAGFYFGQVLLGAYFADAMVRNPWLVAPTTNLRSHLVAQQRKELLRRRLAADRTVATAAAGMGWAGGGAAAAAAAAAAGHTTPRPGQSESPHGAASPSQANGNGLLAKLMRALTPTPKPSGLSGAGSKDTKAGGSFWGDDDDNDDTAAHRHDDQDRPSSVSPVQRGAKRAHRTAAPAAASPAAVKAGPLARAACATTLGTAIGDRGAGAARLQIEDNYHVQIHADLASLLGCEVTFAMNDGGALARRRVDMLLGEAGGLSHGSRSALLRMLLLLVDMLALRCVPAASSTSPSTGSTSSVLPASALMATAKKQRHPDDDGRDQEGGSSKPQGWAPAPECTIQHVLETIRAIREELKDQPQANYGGFLLHLCPVLFPTSGHLFMQLKHETVAAVKAGAPARRTA